LVTNPHVGQVNHNFAWSPRHVFTLLIWTIIAQQLL
jgi:hypothetical protein